MSIGVKEIEKEIRSVHTGKGGNELLPLCRCGKAERHGSSLCDSYLE
ncbi:hypothetical protein IV102_31185 [bacterium]|nr:hypothetical protein [bacterium]